MSNDSEDLPLNYSVSFMSYWNASIMLCSYAVNLSLGEAVSVYPVKRLSEINASEGNGHPLLSALILEL